MIHIEWSFMEYENKHTEIITLFHRILFWNQYNILINFLPTIEEAADGK